MKILFKIVVATLLALCFASYVYAGEPTPKYWNCMQIGHLNDTPVVVVSSIQTVPYDDMRRRENIFAKAVRRAWKLKGEYEPLCQDFGTKAEYEAFYAYIVKKANRAGLIVLPMDFKFGELHAQKAQD